MDDSSAYLYPKKAGKWTSSKHVADSHLGKRQKIRGRYSTFLPICLKRVSFILVTTLDTQSGQRRDSIMNSRHDLRIRRSIDPERPWPKYNAMRSVLPCRRRRFRRKDEVLTQSR